MPRDSGGSSYSPYYGRQLRQVIPTYTAPDREERETARQVLNQVQTGAGFDRETTISPWTAKSAQQLYAEQLKRDQAAQAAIRQRNADKIAAGKAAQEAAYKKQVDSIQDNQVNKLPVIMNEVTGRMEYDVQAIGEQMGMDAEQIREAQNTNFGSRQISTSAKLDDLISGQDSAINNAGQQASQWTAAGADLNPQQAVINNLTGLDPLTARVNFDNEDHLINLTSKGYMKDIGSIDPHERLGKGQEATGIGKHAQVYLPAAVAAFGSLIGGPLVGAGFQAFMSSRAPVAGEQSWGDWGKQAALNAGISVGGALAGGALSGGAKAGMAGTSISEGAGAGMGEAWSNLTPTLGGMENIPAGTSALEVNMSPGDFGEYGTVPNVEAARYAANLEAGMHGGLGGNLGQANVFQSPTGMADPMVIENVMDIPKFDETMIGGASNTKVAMMPWGHTAISQTGPDTATATPLTSGNIEANVPSGMLNGAMASGGFFPRPTIEQLGGPYREMGTDLERANALEAPINQVQPEVTPIDQLGQMATGMGTIQPDGSFQTTPGVTDPISGLDAGAIVPQTGGNITNEADAYFQPGWGDLATLLGGVGLPILSNLLSDRQRKKTGGADEALISGLDMSSEGGGEDPFSEMQMISAGIR